MGEGGSRGGGTGTRAWIFSRRASGPAYTAQYPDVIKLKSEIAALERVPKTTAAVGEEFRILDPAVPARNAVAPSAACSSWPEPRPEGGGRRRDGRRSARWIVPFARRAAGVQQVAGPGDHPAHRRHQPGPASPLAASGPDRDRTGPGRARLLSPRERQRPAGLSLLARNALSGRQIPRSARNLA